MTSNASYTSLFFNISIIGINCDHSLLKSVHTDEVWKDIWSVNYKKQSKVLMSLETEVVYNTVRISRDNPPH